MSGLHISGDSLVKAEDKQISALISTRALTRMVLLHRTYATKAMQIMRDITYVKIDELDHEALSLLLNKNKIRAHLIDHTLYDSKSLKTWIQTKIEMDYLDGCRVRGIISNNSTAGWCGIQFEVGKYEIAIVLDDNFWGLGKIVFNDILRWAKELGHDEIYIHLLHTRPEYKFLSKIAMNVFKTELAGNKFTTYQIPVI